MKDLERVTKENERLIEEFKRYLERKGTERYVVERHVENASQYALYYTTYGFEPKSAKEIDGFEIHCFLGEFLIRKVVSCTPAYINEVAKSVREFCHFLKDTGIIDEYDLEEALERSDVTDKYIRRLEEYNQLISSGQFNKVDSWRMRVYEEF
jgi:hypothetical protein